MSNLGTTLNPISFTPFRCHWAKVFQAVGFKYALVVVRMMSAAGHYFKVLWPVIGFYSVDMVNHFTFTNRSTKRAGHYQNVFAYKSTLVRIGMVGSPYENISALCRNVTATLKSWVSTTSPRTFWSSHMLFFISHRGERGN